MLHVHPVPLELQVATPAAQVPFAASFAAQVPVSFGVQGQVSFVRPLQFESSFGTAQLSDAAGSTVHVPQTPFAQVVLPLAQAPLAPSAAPQVFVVPLMQVHPSLATPLQLPSLPLSQVSEELGPTAPWQLPQTAAPASSITQVCVPFLQGAVQVDPSLHFVSSGMAGANG
jgi:hypothetical protein